MVDLSVELEPPKDDFYRQERVSPIELELRDYVGYVDLISITNRPVFGLSALTMANRVQKLIKQLSTDPVRISVHMTTRISIHDIYRAIVDTHNMQLSDILPLLGDPRGPTDPNYFENGFELLGFISYLKNGKVEHLSNKFQEMHQKKQLPEPIEGANYNLGTVVDLNPTKIVQNNKTIEIREKQLRFTRRKIKMGAEYLISQGIFDAQYYFDFVDSLDEPVEIIPGILPARINLINWLGLPVDRLDKQRLRAAFTSDEAKIEGNKISNRVFNELIDGGCKKIHIYSIGSSKNFFDIAGIPFEPES